MTVSVYADKFYFDDRLEKSGYLTIEDGKFGDFSETRPTGTKVIDYSGFSIAPGLVDTHIHGFKGYDVMDNELDGLKMMSKEILPCGVTSFLPTTLTASEEQINSICKLIGKYNSEVDEAKIQGLFLEGPFFSEKYKGAQNPKYMSNPSIKKLANWQELAEGKIRKVAVAPELEGVPEFCDYAVSHGMHVALGHSNATYEQAKVAVEHGANIFIHTYNGMRGLHHREPGMVGAALYFKDVYDEIICDGYHVNPISLKILADAHGLDKTLLITDCMRAGGMGECESALGEFSVIVKNGKAVLKNGGSLAGSVLELIQAVQNVVSWGIAEPSLAIKMASLIPAQSVGLDDVCGHLSSGYNADFIVLDNSLKLQATYLNGRKVYEKYKGV